MAHIDSIRYSRPVRYVRPTAWARDWRRRWCRTVGSVHQHGRTEELVAFYSDDRDPAARLALQAELESRPNGIAEVVAVCRSLMAQWNKQFDDHTTHVLTDAGQLLGRKA